MLIENITLTGNNKGVDVPIPTIEMVGLNLNFISGIKNFLEGTDSNEWLKKANENVLIKLKNGS